jgi:hypothetical protein
MQLYNADLGHVFMESRRNPPHLGEYNTELKLKSARLEGWYQKAIGSYLMFGFDNNVW